MSCRKINNRYDNEGYIIKEIDLESLCNPGKKSPYFPKEISSNILQQIFKDFDINNITQQAIIQQYNELYIYNEATEDERNILAPQVKVFYSLFNLPQIYYPKFIPLVEEKEVWTLNERDLGIKLGTRLHRLGISFFRYKDFAEKVSNLCEEFNLREDDILLNPSNIGYHPVLGLRIIDYGLTNDNQLFDF